MSPPGCPDVEALTRATSMAPDPSLTAHLAGCPGCQARWEEANLMRDLGRLLPHDRPGAARRERVRAEVLERARDLPAATWGARSKALVAGSAAAAVAMLVATGVQLQRHDDLAAGPRSGGALAPHRPPSRLEPSPGARFLVQAGPPHEVVRLSEGTLRITVEPLAGGARSFRVIAPDAEVEVRGTIFETTVAGGRLVAVRVQRGRVLVRPQREPPVAVTAGGQWLPAVAAPEPARETPAAERAFQIGLRDRSPRIQRSARDGLRAAGTAAPAPP